MSKEWKYAIHLSGNPKDQTNLILLEDKQMKLNVTFSSIQMAKIKKHITSNIAFILEKVYANFSYIHIVK